VSGHPTTRPLAGNHAGANAKGTPVTKNSYEIRVTGSLGPAAREAFSDLLLDVEPTTTVLIGDLDQVQLHALLDRVRALGLELVDVRQAPTHTTS
jgi:hypothetical protein